MKTYAQVKLIACGKKEFDDKEGNPVRYFENIIKDQAGSVATVNSQADYSDCEGKEGIAHLFLKENGKVSLKAFVVGETIDLPEEVVN